MFFFLFKFYLVTGKNSSYYYLIIELYLVVEFIARWLVLIRINNSRYPRGNVLKYSTNRGR